MDKSLNLILTILMIVGLLKLDFVIIGFGICTCLGILGIIKSLKRLSNVGSDPKKRQRAMFFIVCSGLALAIMNIALVIYLIVNYIKLFIFIFICAFCVSILKAIILKMKK